MATLTTTAPLCQKKVISKDEWEKKLKAVKIDKSDLNKLVMNYLVIEGYKDAAEKFGQETGLSPAVNMKSIQDRMEIRQAIQNGKIDEAIEKTNDLNPEILDTNPSVYFHLQQQRLIELIRTGNVLEALEFAQEELAPRGEENPEFLEELERTMALFAFDNGGMSPVADLLEFSHRQKTASELNAAILTSQSQDKDPKLPKLLKLLVWSQNQLEEKVSYPKITNLVSGALDESCHIEGSEKLNIASTESGNNLTAQPPMQISR